MEYRDSFKEKLEKIDEYENKINELWNKCEDSESILFLNNLRMEISIETYKYLNFLEEIVMNHKDEEKLYRVKDYATIFSYVLATTSLFIAPQISLPSFMGSIFLSVRKRIDEYKKNSDLLEIEEAEYVNSKLDNLDEDYTKKLEILEDKLHSLTTEEVINSLEEPAKTNRIASKLLLDLFEHSLKSRKIDIQAPENVQEGLKNIIQEYYKFDSQDTEELVSLALSDYVNKAIKLYDIKETTRKRIHKSKRSYYK